MWKFLTILFMFLFSTVAFASDEPNRVKKVLTPIEKVELAEVLKDAHYSVFGEFPSEKRLAVAWAHVGIENRQGLSVYNHNLGNITSTKNRKYYVNGFRFRAHDNFEQGAVDYWRVVKKMCSSSFQYFDKGNPYAAAQRLKRCGYYEADADKYGKAMIWLYRHAMDKVLPKMEN